MAVTFETDLFQRSCKRIYASIFKNVGGDTFWKIDIRPLEKLRLANSSAKRRDTDVDRYCDATVYVN